MRIERVSSNKVGQFAVVLEVICVYVYRIYYFWYDFFPYQDLTKIIFASCQKVFEVAHSLFMVDVRKAAGDTLEYHKVSCFYIYLHFESQSKMVSSYAIIITKMK